MQIEKNIAATLRHRMEAEKKSKLEFSKELGIPRSTFQGYLKGENCLRSDSIEEIAKGLNITPAQLISGPEDTSCGVPPARDAPAADPGAAPAGASGWRRTRSRFCRPPSARLAGADVHRCARLRAGCSGGHLPIFSAGDLAAGAHALLLRSSWPAAAKRLLDDACGHLSLSDDRAAVERLAKLCTTQQLDPVHLFDVIHDFLDQEAATV
ncbi:MAG: DUF6514 family protein [Blautia wexlerae]